MVFSANCNHLNQLECLQRMLMTHSSRIPSYLGKLGLLFKPSASDLETRTAFCSDFSNSAKPPMTQGISNCHYCSLLHLHSYLTLIKITLTIFDLCLCLLSWFLRGDSIMGSDKQGNHKNIIMNYAWYFASQNQHTKKDNDTLFPSTIHRKYLLCANQ